MLSLTISVPLDLRLVPVQDRVDDHCAAQTHGFTFSSKWNLKPIHNVSLEGNAVLRHGTVYRQSTRQKNQNFDRQFRVETVFTHGKFTQKRKKNMTVKKDERLRIQRKPQIHVHRVAVTQKGEKLLSNMDKSQ